MNIQRALFLVLITLAIFSLKLYFIIGNISGPIIFPDEITYGTSFSLFDASLYSIIPSFFGYLGSVTFNSMITSLCAIPIFYLFRKSFGEREATILAVVTSFWGPLWLYSFVNMTEASLFFVLLNAVLLISSVESIALGAIATMIKPTGIIAFLARFNYGIVLAIIGGIIYAYFFPNYSTIPQWQNFVLCFSRSIGYVLAASCGLICLPIMRRISGVANKIDMYVTNILFINFGLLLGLMFLIPVQYFYGRYFDPAILVILPVALNSRPKKKDLQICLAGMFIGCILLLGATSDLVLDSGIMIFTDILHKVAFLNI